MERITHLKIVEYFFLNYQKKVGIYIVLHRENGLYFTSIYQRENGIDKITKTNISPISGLKARAFFNYMQQYSPSNNQ